MCALYGVQCCLATTCCRTCASVCNTACTVDAISRWCVCIGYLHVMDWSTVHAYQTMYGKYIVWCVHNRRTCSKLLYIPELLPCIIVCNSIVANGIMLIHASWSNCTPLLLAMKTLSFLCYACMLVFPLHLCVLCLLPQLFNLCTPL